MKLKRKNEIYNIIEYLPDSKEVCVEKIFEFAQAPYKRKLKMWWALKDDDEILKDACYNLSKKR